MYESEELGLRRRRRHLPLLLLMYSSLVSSRSHPLCTAGEACAFGDSVEYSW